VNAQRGDGVFDSSIRALQNLNRLGYPLQELLLDLVYNPNGAFLPQDQAGLEVDYKRELLEHLASNFISSLSLPICQSRVTAHC